MEELENKIYPADEDRLNIAKAEAEFINHFWSRKYEEGIKSLKNTLENTEETSNNTLAWHLLWFGYCYQQLNNIDKANEIYKRAHGKSKNIPSISPIYDYESSSLSINELPLQIIEVVKYLSPSNKGQISITIPKGFDTDLAVLDGSGTPPQTEEAIRALGEYLGLVSSRPDKEFKTGPDVLWYIADSPALVLELKTDKDKKTTDKNQKIEASPDLVSELETNKDKEKKETDKNQKPLPTTKFYTKRDLGQLRDHLQWMKDEYPLIKEH